MTKRVRLVVRGRVQGVFFRAATKQTADGLGVSGTVRNLPGGGVEVVAEGLADAVDALVAWCRKGPPQAHVTDLSLTVEQGSAGYRGFRILHS